MKDLLWKSRSRLRSYTYYERREQFVRTLSSFNEWALIGVESGAFDYDTGREKGHALPGQLLLVAPHQPCWRSATITPFTYHVLQWRWDDDANWQAGLWPIRDTNRLFADYALLRPLFNRADEWAPMRIENLLEDILMLAWETRYEPQEINDPTMRQAAQLLRQRAGQAFAMSEVSNEVGLRPVQFTRRFRRAHGVTPIEYLTHLRLEKARHLLIETDEALDEIAHQCGWSSGYYLSDVYKTAYGLAPGKFRRLHRV